MRAAALIATALLVGCAADAELADYNDMLHQMREAPVTRAQYDARMAAGRRAQDRFWDSQFTDSGLESAETLRARGDATRRAFIRVFLPGPLPAVELVRHRDGSLTVRASARGGGITLEAPATTDDWREATARDADAFAPLERTQRRRGEPLPPPPPICHGTTVFLDGMDGDSHWRAAASGSCTPVLEGRQATMDAGFALYATAARRLPQCGTNAASAEDGFRAMLGCFGRLSWEAQRAKDGASR